MTARARLTQERSRHRREQLIDAAIELFVAGGSRAVTHRAVATLAGLPAATTTYYFASIEDLLRAALHEYGTRWVALMGNALNFTPTIEQVTDFKTVRRLINLILREYPVEDTTRDANIYLACARDPQLIGLAKDTITGFERVIADLLRPAGIAAPELIARAMVATCLGFAIRRASGSDDRVEADQLARTIIALVAAAQPGGVWPEAEASRSPDADVSGRSDASLSCTS